MKSIIVIAIIVGIGALIAIIVGSYYIQNQTEFMGRREAKPWGGGSGDEMIDFSGSNEHHSMHESMHMEFHQYYYDHCSETELGKP